MANQAIFYAGEDKGCTDYPALASCRDTRNYQRTFQESASQELTLVARPLIHTLMAADNVDPVKLGSKPRRTAERLTPQPVAVDGRTRSCKQYSRRKICRNLGRKPPAPLLAALSAKYLVRPNQSSRRGRRRHGALLSRRCNPGANPLAPRLRSFWAARTSARRSGTAGQTRLPAPSSFWADGAEQYRSLWTWVDWAHNPSSSLILRARSGNGRGRPAARWADPV